MQFLCLSENGRRRRSRARTNMTINRPLHEHASCTVSEGRDRSPPPILRYICCRSGCRYKVCKHETSMKAQATICDALIVNVDTMMTVKIRLIRWKFKKDENQSYLWWRIWRNISHTRSTISCHRSCKSTLILNAIDGVFFYQVTNIYLYLYNIDIWFISKLFQISAFCIFLFQLISHKRGCCQWHKH